jgi:transposase
MGKARNITSESVAQIVILRQEGLTQCEIARKLKLNQSIVSRAVKRYKETSSFCYKKSPGAPRCTSHQTDRMMRRMVVASPTCSSSEIQAKLPPDTSVSTRTIRRRLQLHFKLRAYHPASKPRLSTKNVKDRLAFALKYRNSPDLSPIENCWAVMKKKVSILKPTSREDLLEKIKRVWCSDISPEYCAQLIKSMPDRIAAVIKAKGGLTKY